MRLGTLFALVLAAVSVSVPAAATGTNNKYPREQGGQGKRCKPGTTILELVFCASGSSGYDTRRKDYDILRQLIIAADLVDAVAGLEENTVFMPTDIAFERLAEALGYEADNGYDEEATFAFLAAALGDLGDLKEVITTVILYHVADEEYSFKKLRKGKTVTTLQGGTIEAKPTKKKVRVLLKDKDRDFPDPLISDKYRDLNTSQGPVHVISRVLLPLDL